MRLLAPSENKSLKEQETVRAVLRTQEVEKAAEQSRKNLASAEADFNATLARNLEVWAREEELHNKRVVEMEKETESLEAKRLNALIPIGVIKKGAEDRMKEAVDFMAKLRKRESDAECLVERLETQLDSVGQREQDVKQAEKRLGLQKEGIERQKQSSILGSKRLSEEIAKFAHEREKAEKDIDERKTAIYLQERSLIAKEQVQKRTDKSLNDLAKRLEDERETLARAWAELKRLSPYK